MGFKIGLLPHDGIGPRWMGWGGVRLIEHEGEGLWNDPSRIIAEYRFSENDEEQMYKGDRDLRNTSAHRQARDAMARLEAGVTRDGKLYIEYGPTEVLWDEETYSYSMKVEGTAHTPDGVMSCYVTNHYDPCMHSHRGEIEAELRDEVRRRFEEKYQ